MVDFLETLAQRTSVRRSVGASHVWSECSEGVRRWAALAPAQADIAAGVSNALRDRLASMDVSLPRVHGDFTPWNTFSAPNGVYVIDWEWSREVGLPLYDFFNFVVHGEVSNARAAPHDVVRGYFFRPNAPVREAVRRLSTIAGIRPHREAYDFFQLYLLHWIAFNLTLSPTAGRDHERYADLFMTLQEREDFRRERWLGGEREVEG